jgi:hypothetical protein
MLAVQRQTAAEIPAPRTGIEAPIDALATAHESMLRQNRHSITIARWFSFDRQTTSLEWLHVVPQVTDHRVVSVASVDELLA